MLSISLSIVNCDDLDGDCMINWNDGFPNCCNFCHDIDGNCDDDDDAIGDDDDDGGDGGGKECDD